MNIARKNQFKRILILTISCFLIALCSGFLCGGSEAFGQVTDKTAGLSSAQEASQTTEKTSKDYEFSKATDFIGGMSISGNTLTVYNVPDMPSYGYLWFQLVRAELPQTQVFDSKPQKVNSGSIVFSLPSLSDGKYNVKLFGGPKSSGSYQGIFFNEDIQIKVDKAGLSFLTPAQYEHNKEIQKSRRTDKYILAHYLKPSDDIQSKNTDIVALATRITSGIESDYEKAMAIHDYVANNIYYDYDAYYRNTYAQLDLSATGMLKSKKGVCEGYANLTAALLRASKIPAKKIHGYALGIGAGTTWPASNDQTNHAWNEAYVDGRWIIMDTTWDSGNEWQNGGISKSDGLRNHKYFDPALMLFSADHRIAKYNEAGLELTAPKYTLKGVKSGVKISWKKVSNAKKYLIYRSTSSSSKGWKLIKTTTGTTFTDKNVKKNKTYWYRVLSANDYGKSENYWGYYSIKNR